MKTINKILLSLVLFILLSGALFANPIQPWDHEFNPSLLSTGKRKVLEVGFSANMAVSNSYFGLTDIFQKELLIDLNAMATDLKDSDLIIAMKTEVEAHTFLSLFNVTVGGYSTIDGIVSTSVPGSFFEVVADGLLLDDSITGTGEIYGRVYTSMGIYGGYRWNDWQFGTKVGAFLPIAYSDKTASYDYSALLNSNGNISASAGVTIPVYMPFDPQNPDAAAIMSGMGYSLDLGAIKLKDGEPHYGFQLTGLTLSPAVMSHKANVSAGASVSATDLASFQEDSEPWTLTTEEPDAEISSDSLRVNMPLSAGGFYRLTGYPSFIDWIGQGEMIWDNDILLFAGGVTAQGAIFPLNMLSLSLGYDRVMWETTAGLRMNLRVIELGMDVGLANTRFVKMFTTNGIYANFYLAMGW
jgi:hypothetical protein